MKRMFNGMVLGAMLLLLPSSSVQANTILQDSDPNPPLVLSGSDQSNDDITTKVQAYFQVTLGGQLNNLYKANQSDGSEENAFSDSYTTTFGVDVPKANALITWDGDPYINASPVYALIKDGNLPGDGLTWYLFQLGNWNADHTVWTAGWNGTDDILFQGFFGGNQGKISHVEIWGLHKDTDPPDEVVPDGGLTVGLLGLGLLGLGLMRRCTN